eukprot:30234-Pelagococcus_subviridis.AAC.3
MSAVSFSASAAASFGSMSYVSFAVSASNARFTSPANAAFLERVSSSSSSAARYRSLTAFTGVKNTFTIGSPVASATSPGRTNSSSASTTPSIVADGRRRGVARCAGATRLSVFADHQILTLRALASTHVRLEPRLDRAVRGEEHVHDRREQRDARGREQDPRARDAVVVHHLPVRRDRVPVAPFEVPEKRRPAVVRGRVSRVVDLVLVVVLLLALVVVARRDLGVVLHAVDAADDVATEHLLRARDHLRRALVRCQIVAQLYSAMARVSFRLAAHRPPRPRATRQRDRRAPLRAPVAAGERVALLAERVRRRRRGVAVLLFIRGGGGGVVRAIRQIAQHAEARPQRVDDVPLDVLARARDRLPAVRVTPRRDRPAERHAAAAAAAARGRSRRGGGGGARRA